ncbi:MAG: murein biosynthesis integral membrane protein MurJ [Candidatus Omnitrophica bacterium]|nr:murein biosynthesis integral membrane protein MurJ [Candidatus Omnitrophota bacterium]
MSEHKAIFKSAGVLSVFTVISRITGFLRDVLLANVFGTGLVAQAFFVAFKIPNMLREVIGEGAGNAAFVPVFCEYLERKPRQDFLKLVNSLLILVMAVSLIIVCLGVVFASPLIRIIAPGFSQDPAKFRLTVDLTRFLFPYLILVTLSAYLASVSNAFKSFAVPASSSTVFNIVLIIAIWIMGMHEGWGSIYSLGAAVLLAGVAQAAMQYPFLSRLGVDFKAGGFYEKPLKHEAIRKVGRLILPRLLGGSIYQLNIFIDTIFASLTFFVGDGAIAAIYYANRIIQFPFSVFGVALSNAALPAMSSHSAQKDLEKFKATLNFSFKTVFLCILPLMTGILIFALPLVRAIYERGRFDAYSSVITARAVFFYSLGLIGYVGVRFFSTGFYAMQDTLTPVKTSSIALMTNIILNSIFVFVFKFGLPGLALASSISANLNFFILFRAMKARIGFCFTPELRKLVFKACGASIIMGVVSWHAWSRWFADLSDILGMFCLVISAASVYFLILWWWRVSELKELFRWLRKKK